jgi:hypothetical protein
MSMYACMYACMCVRMSAYIDIDTYKCNISARSYKHILNIHYGVCEMILIDFPTYANCMYEICPHVHVCMYAFICRVCIYVSMHSRLYVRISMIHREGKGRPAESMYAY